MVRTKWCPNPFVDHYGTTVAQLSVHPNEIGLNGSTFNFPKRIKLKARRRFTERPVSRKSLKSPPPTGGVDRNSPWHSGTNKMTAGISSRHRRQKSLHRIFTNVQVNVCLIN